MSAPVDIDRYYELRSLTSLAVSPDGQTVAFVTAECDATDDERRHALSLVPADGSREPYRLSRASSVSAPKFSPDGTKLAVLAAREDDLAGKAGRGEPEEDGDDTDESDERATGNAGGGAEDKPKRQVWVYDLEFGGDARQVTAFEEGVREFDWSPEGDRLVVSARDPTDDEREYLEQRRDDGPIEVTRLQHKRDGAGWLDDVTTYLFVVDARTDGDPDDAESARRLDAAYGAGSGEPLSGLQPRWGPCDRIAFLTNDTDRPDDSLAMDVFTIAPDGTDRRKHTDGTLRVSAPRFSPDGGRLAFVGGNPENWYEPSEVFVVSVDSTSTSDGYRSLSASLDRTVARAGAPTWTDDETLLCPFADEGLTRLVALDATGDAPRRTFEWQGTMRTLEALDEAGGTVAVCCSCPADGPVLYAFETEAAGAAQVSSLDEPTVLANPSDEGVTQLHALNESVLEDLPTPAVRRVTFENSDDEEVEAIVYLPPGFVPGESEPAPTVAAIHGGPMSYDAPTFRFEHTLWTSRGYIVVRVNYRGSTSYGREFAERLKGSRGRLESDDVVSGVRRLVDDGWADPENLFVTGFSYGGITTAHIVTRYDDFAAGAPEHGIYDFYSNVGTDDNHAWHEWEFGMPWEHPDTYREISSITDVDRIETPLLITAGEEDWRCPPTQAEQLYVSVRKRGVDAKLVIYPNEHHNIGDPTRATHRLRELTRWFDQYRESSTAE